MIMTIMIGWLASEDDYNDVEHDAYDNIDNGDDEMMLSMFKYTI